MPRFYLLGFVFALVWSSASVAAKIGLSSVQPLMLYQFRFTLAAICMLLILGLVRKGRLPRGKEWRQLAIFGFLNATLALGLFVLAIQEVAAGIGALQVGLNPLVITLLSSLFVGRRIKSLEILALLLGITGVAVAVYPLFEESYVTVRGLLFLGLSTLAYSSAAVYFSHIRWDLDKLTINAWQTFFGALFLLPFTFLLFEDSNNFDTNFLSSLLWLGIPVSIGAVFLWLWLLTQDTIKASYFLFLCPAFGLFYAYFLLGEPFSYYTLAGLLIVLSALYTGQIKKGRN